MTAGEPGGGPSSEDARLTSLNERLDRAQQEEAVRTGKLVKPADANYVAGNRVLADLIGGLGGGALMGWLIDKIFGTWPAFFVGLMILGIAAAFWMIIKRSSGRA